MSPNSALFDPIATMRKIRGLSARLMGLTARRSKNVRLKGNRMDRVERLLKAGYFPSQLPPAFTTRDLATTYKLFHAAWVALLPEKDGKKPIPKSIETKVEIFSVARVGHQRRITCLPNPVAQTFVSARIVKYWGSIVAHYRK